MPAGDIFFESASAVRPGVGLLLLRLCGAAGVGGEVLKLLNRDMVNCPEIDCPYAYELYHKKGVVFRVKTGGRVETRKGRFCVAEDSRGMRIDFEVEGLDGHTTPQQLPLSQETVESIKPATKLVSDQYGDAVSFVIARILSSPSQPGCDQRAA